MSELLPEYIRTNPRLCAWFSFRDGPGIVLRTGKVEIGQGILLALRQIAAEELDLPLGLVDVVSGDTARSPDEHGTFASLSIMTSGPAIRVAASELRGRLFAAAAGQMGVSETELSSMEGEFLRHGNPCGVSYWSVASTVDLGAPISGSFAPKSPDEYRLVGTSPVAEHLADRLKGGAFIHDLALKGMLYGRALRQPFWGAKLVEADLDAIRSRPGIVSAVRDGNFLGIVAETETTLASAMGSVDRFVRWEVDSEPAEELLPVELLDRSDAEAFTVTQMLPQRERNWQYQASFSKPMIGHGSIGPSCAVARSDRGALEIWTHSQNVFAMREQFARVLSLTKETIVVRHLPGAGCYGHNGADDVAMDAALLSRAVPGHPVRVQWSRLDELRAEPLGSPMRVSISASLQDGKIDAWRLVTRSGTHVQRPGWNGEVNLLAAAALENPWPFAPPVDVPLALGGGGGAKNSIAGYNFPQDVIGEYVQHFPFRLSALRSLGAFANVFAIESAMDDLALLAERDPVAFRLDHLSDSRSRRVIETVAAMSNWESASGNGGAKGIGFAQFENESSYCAVVSEVEVDEEVRLVGMWAAVDPGLAIDPAGVRAQVEGGMIQAASWTLKEAVPTRGRRITSETWGDYPILRFDEIPEVNVKVISDARFPATGVGEVSLGPTGAAIANGVARALGIRIRELPITRDRVVATIMSA
jgi:nicotinate dehydrogenase subunit B